MIDKKTVVVSIRETLTRKGTAIAHCSDEKVAEKLAGVYKMQGYRVNIYSEAEFKRVQL